MKQTIYWSAAIVALVGLMLWARPSGSAPSKVSAATSTAPVALVAAETLYDFGTIRMADGIKNHIFTVANPTNADVEVKTVVTSCMCTTAYIETDAGEKGPFGMVGMGYVPPANEVIKAGESRNIKVVFDPNAHGPAGVGIIDRIVTLTDAQGAALKLEIKAVVTP